MHAMQGFTDRFVVGICLTAVGWVLAGCEAPTKRLNAPPQGHTEYPHEEMQAHYTPMVDNALLNDMSMSNIHFVPHQSELNATGIRRLQRYAEILKIYGGTLNYDGVQDSQDLADRRIRRIEDYLASAGLGREQYKVERGMAGGRGMNAEEAMMVRTDNYYKPGGSGGSTAGPLEQLFMGSGSGASAKKQ